MEFTINYTEAEQRTFKVLVESLTTRGVSEDQAERMSIQSILKKRVAVKAA